MVTAYSPAKAPSPGETVVNSYRPSALVSPCAGRPLPLIGTNETPAPPIALPSTVTMPLTGKGPVFEQPLALSKQIQAAKPAVLATSAPLVLTARWQAGRRFGNRAG